MNPIIWMLIETVGSLFAAVVGWKTGHQLYLGNYQHAMRTAAPGARFPAAVNLRAKGALVGWPVAALMTYLALMVFAERPATDELAPEADEALPWRRLQIPLPRGLLGVPGDGGHE